MQQGRGGEEAYGARVNLERASKRYLDSLLTCPYIAFHLHRKLRGVREPRKGTSTPYLTYLLPVISLQALRLELTRSLEPEGLVVGAMLAVEGTPVEAMYLVVEGSVGVFQVRVYIRACQGILGGDGRFPGKINCSPEGRRHQDIYMHMLGSSLHGG